MRLAIHTLAMPVFLRFSLVALVDWCSGVCVNGVGQRELVCLPLCEEGSIALGCVDLDHLSPLTLQLASRCCCVALRGTLHAVCDGIGEYV